MTAERDIKEILGCLLWKGTERNQAEKSAWGLADLYLIFNHRITRLQEEDAGRSLGVERIIELPPDLKEIWCNIPPEIPEISWYIKPV